MQKLRKMLNIIARILCICTAIFVVIISITNCVQSLSGLVGVDSNVGPLMFALGGWFGILYYPIVCAIKILFGVGCCLFSYSVFAKGSKKAKQTLLSMIVVITVTVILLKSIG